MSRKTRSRQRNVTTKRVVTIGARLPNKDELSSLLNWFLPDAGIFSKLKFHGNTKWAPNNLVCLALCWAWSDSRNITDAFTEAAEWYETLLGVSALKTYHGFMNAMVTWSSTLVQVLVLVLQKRMKEVGGRFWRIHGWVPIAFDGSRATAPRSRRNEKFFCAANYGKGKTARYRRKKSKGMRRKKNERNKAQPQGPQAWITMMWHMGVRLPWLWRLGPSNSSERYHVSEMLDTIGVSVREILFCGDAGFVGYPFWASIMDRGGCFLVRVGANVSLLRERADCQLHKGGFVLCWPKTMQAKQPPLRLRLMRVCVGKTKVYLLTNILDHELLSEQQAIQLYKMRWGIELEFRNLKQTVDRSKLRCRNDQRLLAELDWSILAMAVAELFASREQLSKSRQRSDHQPPPTPEKRSLAHTMRAIRYCLRHLNEIPPVGKGLSQALVRAVTDNYQRRGSKKARYRPSNPDQKPLGNPKLRTMTPDERKRLRDGKLAL